MPLIRPGFVAILTAFAIGLTLLVSPRVGRCDEIATLAPISARFADGAASEEPSFQKHVVPLFGRLGCNARACHGSFQGAGGFQLSLFGYDFQFDHDALLNKERAEKKGAKPAADKTAEQTSATPHEPRINVGQPLESLLLTKPTSEENHEGGQRYKVGSWQYHVLRRWIEAGGKFDAQHVEKLAKLEVTPNEIVFANNSETVPLKAVAVWTDGTREDVTPLCRFTTNNEQIAKIDSEGRVSAAEPGDTHVVVSYDKAVVTVPTLRPVSDRVYDKYPAVVARTEIDALVLAKLRKLGIVPSELASDAEFLRRVSLDLAGTLPTPSEVETFLSHTSPNKRAEKIDELLTTPAYAAWWTTKLCDFTGNNDAQLNNVSPMRKAGQEWYDWIYRRVADNMPYDELAAGIVLAESRRPGQSYTEFCQEMSQLYAKDSHASYADRPGLAHYWARNNFRQPEDRAIGFAYSFMGVRIQCAQCHKHPFDVWSKQDFEDFKGFFTRVAFTRNGVGKGSKEEAEKMLAALGIDPKKKGNQLDRDLQKLVVDGKTIPFGELATVPPRNAPKNKKDSGKKGGPPQPVATAKLLGTDETINVNAVDDPRTSLMQWLRSPENPYFARAIVNRVWASYFNVGIVEPPDDMSLGNPPSNEALLASLAKGFIDHHYDLQWLHRTICNSDTYQRSWRTNDTNIADDRNFSHAVPRRLPAEVTYDALQRATAADSRAAAMFTDLKDRAITVASSNPNANGQGKNGFALKVFGRSIRESNCDCDRSMEASLLQTVYLQNDNDMLSALSPTGKGTWMSELNALANPKTPKATAAKNGKGGDDPRRDLAKAKVRLEAAKKLEDTNKIARLETRVKQLETAVAKLAADSATEDSATSSAAASKPAEPAVATSHLPASPALVREAYLRTLSRTPSDTEMNRSLQFLADSASPLQGLRDLMWALLNTKEFIVNH